MPRSRPLVALVFATLAAALACTLTGCSSTVTGLEPAPSANDPACAEVTVRLPNTVDGQSRRWTDAQATGAWGEKTAVLLTCGLETPAPSVLPCETVAGVDWIIDDADAPKYRVTSFGREPAVQLYIDTDLASSRNVLDALSPIVALLPATGSECSERPAS